MKNGKNQAVNMLRERIMVCDEPFLPLIFTVQLSSQKFEILPACYKKDI